MCLVALAIDQSRRFPLVLAGNRDEQFQRAIARLAWWSPGDGLPDVLGGRDMDTGGTWLGLTAQGRLAVVTPVLSPLLDHDPCAPSRGEIATRWLAGNTTADRFWMHTALRGYDGFNLIAADFQQGECFWASNQNTLPVRLERGLYGVSNAALDTPWPKVQALKMAVKEAIEVSESINSLASLLFDALSHRQTTEMDGLPSIDASRERELAQSAAFVRLPDQDFGTRCSTLVIAERANKRLITHVLERTFSPQGGIALLRRSMLKDWPPRYSLGRTAHPSHQEAVTEIHDLHDTPSAPMRRTRVRSLLKPEIAIPRRVFNSGSLPK